MTQLGLQLHQIIIDYFMAFLVHLAKVNVSFCHHLDVSIFKQELTFNSLGKSYLSFSRGEDFLEIKHSETRIACGGHVCYPIGAK
jgi:hypothetical protein